MKTTEREAEALLIQSIGSPLYFDKDGREVFFRWIWLGGLADHKGKIVYRAQDVWALAGEGAFKGHPGLCEGPQDIPLTDELGNPLLHLVTSAWCGWESSRQVVQKIARTPVLVKEQVR